MTYIAGMGPIVAHMLGHEPGEPRVICDGCGLRRPVATKQGLISLWHMKGKGPPGWKLTRTGDKRDDRCPKCKPVTDAYQRGQADRDQEWLAELRAVAAVFEAMEGVDAMAFQAGADQALDEVAVRVLGRHLDGSPGSEGGTR